VISGVLKRRERGVNRWGQLKTERSSWLPDWQECGELILPRSPRFFVQDRNRGGRRASRIIDDSATYALRILGAGLMAGATSPARPWFRLAAPDQELNQYYPVKLWFEEVGLRMMRVFQRSNFYRVVHQLYEDISVFGNAAAVLETDYETVIHLHAIPIGEYCLAQNHKGKVNTFYREFEISIAQIVREFGLERCSQTVQSMFRAGTLDTGVTVIHAIEPREDRDPSQADNLNMPWASVYFETGGPSGQLLRESGYEAFPVLSPRWNVRAGDVYGSGPGLDALGNIKGLQHQQVRKGQAIDYMTAPPLQVPTSMRNRDVDTLPKGITFADSNGQGGGIRPLWETRLDLSHMVLDIEDVRKRIRSAFHTDLFLMLIGGSDTQKTKAEIDARTMEKMVVLGPVLERLTTELLRPAIDLTFDAMLVAGLIPPAPPELQGQALDVEFISVLAQAQRAIGTGAVDRFLGNIGVVAQWAPDVRDKVDTDEWADSYADMLGVNPKLLVPNEQVQALREARNAAMAAKEQAALQQQQAATARDLGSTPVGEGTALDALGMFSGYQ
jgi:hypothetical protein